MAGAWVVRAGWVSRGRLAAAGGVTGALAVLLIGLTWAAGGLLGAVAALGGVLPATLTAGTGIVLAGQSGVALGSEEERARLFAAASCILLFRTAQPAELAALAGTERVAEGAWQVDDQELTGRQTITMRARARVDQDQVRQLPTDEADLIVRGLGKRLRIIRTVVPGSAVEQARELIAGIARPRLRAPCPGTLRPNRDRPGRSPPGYQVRRRRLKLRAGHKPGRLLRSLTRRRCPRSGDTGRPWRAKSPARKPTATTRRGEAIATP